MVLAAAWEDDGEVDEWSLDRVTVASDALLTGNLSLELHAVDPTENRVDYRLLMGTGGSRRAVLCSVCLRSAGQCPADKANWAVLSRTDSRGDCSQPGSAPRCCSGTRPTGEGPATPVAPAAVSPDRPCAGSSTAPRSRPKDRCGPRRRRTQTPASTASQAA